MKTRLISLAACLTLCSSVPGFAGDKNKEDDQLIIHMRDYCDPESFNAVLGPDGCGRDTTSGAITFSGFSAELVADKSVGAWRFVPEKVHAEKGTQLQIENLGGELHTFTEVKRFGGGFVAPLNEASGNLKPAPECAQIVDGNLVPQPPGPDNLFIPAGGSASEELEGGHRVVRYQCCIHPWMRLTIKKDNDDNHESHHD